MNKSIGFIIIRVITAGLLFWALSEHPYSYYNILRIVVCAVCIYGVVKSIQIEKKGWSWIFGVISIIFNPIVPVHLDRETWAVIDVISGIIIIISIFFLKEKKMVNGMKEKLK